MPPPAPTECNVPSGFTCPLPPRTIIRPCLIVAAMEPVFLHPALVKVHRPSNAVRLGCGGEPGSRSLLLPDKNARLRLAELASTAEPTATTSNTARHAGHRSVNSHGFIRTPRRQSQKLTVGGEPCNPSTTVRHEVVTHV